MEREIMVLYCQYEDLIDRDIQGLSLEELFELRFEVLMLRKTIMERLDTICA